LIVSRFFVVGFFEHNANFPSPHPPIPPIPPYSIESVSTALDSTEPTQWFQNDTILSFIVTGLAEIAAFNKEKNFFPNLKHNKRYSPTEIQLGFVGWLYQRDCIYLDLIQPSYKQGQVAPVGDNISFLFTEDGAGLCMEYFTDEYQLIKNKKLDDEVNKIDEKSKTTQVPITPSSPSPSSPSSPTTEELPTLVETTPPTEQLDLNVLLRAMPEKPSFSQHLIHLLHTLSNYILDVEMYLVSHDLEQNRDKLTQDEIKTKIDAQQYYGTTSLLAISPPQNPDLNFVQEFFINFSKLDNYFSSQKNLYSQKHFFTSQVFPKLFPSLRSTDNCGKLLSSLVKHQMSQLTNEEMTVIDDLLGKMEIDYKTRHDKLLQKMLTQTQTFLFSLKLKFLQIEQQQQQQQQQNNDKINGNKSIAENKPIKKNQPPQKGKKQPKNKGKPIEDGADEEYDSDDDADSAFGTKNDSKFNFSSNFANLQVHSVEYRTMLAHIITKFKQAIKLISFLHPIVFVDLFLAGSALVLLLPHGNERQLHRFRVKFQLSNHPRMNTLGKMADRGGRLH